LSWGERRKVTGWGLFLFSREPGPRYFTKGPISRSGKNGGWRVQSRFASERGGKNEQRRAFRLRRWGLEREESTKGKGTLFCLRKKKRGLEKATFSLGVEAMLRKKLID